ncbi:GPI-inositol-deacylase [Pholiota conissans]|uniref:GPI inositol-deacylase n=1 Tax=Pholiota conissans TaxID=109636 RepID=A0A9P5YZ52_9AGAR|nr:GPI-inositol-deacylase [Pholiota conissans]
MPTLIAGFTGILSLLTVLLFYLSTSDISETLSPQGCRMSWMSPSYVQLADFNESWSPLSHRYSLWLYREVGWDSLEESTLRRDSLPVLFIPGNAGSSHQVRSIASSATRQYFSSPHVVSSIFASRSMLPLDFFAVEFNEDLSAFHSSTLESQIAYSAQAIPYILSLYPPETQIIVMGHSMGGVVATSLLPSNNISTVITMSTPHTLPPARFDFRIEKLYRNLQTILNDDPIPIVSICGGATDMMIPSESCILPRASKGVFRRTVFTSALEGAWTGVGHREMVWCHQVRWRVARAALELSAAHDVSSRSMTLDKWLRDGHSLPPMFDQEDKFDTTNAEMLPAGERLVLRQPLESKKYLLPAHVELSDETPQKITVLLSRGSISTVAPEISIPLRISVFNCVGFGDMECVALKPEILRLIPNPIPGKSFPAPQEGSDESEGVVLFEGHIPKVNSQQWVGIDVQGADGQGWVVAGIGPKMQTTIQASSYALALAPLLITLPTDTGLSTSFTFPNLMSNALVVYRVTTQRSAIQGCSDALLSPLLMHTSHAAETHYFPLANAHNKRTLIHTHLDAPFIDQTQHFPSYVNFTIISSADSDCVQGFSRLEIAVDWSATFGRWASRYLHTLVSWSAGVASVVVFFAWAQQDAAAPMPTVDQSLGQYNQKLWRYFLPLSLIISILPFREWVYVGNKGRIFLAPIAPIVLLTASGLVCVVWWLLSALLFVIGQISTFIYGSRPEQVSVPRSTILSLSIICLIIFLFVPWQVAYVGCWLLHLYTCASSARHLAIINSSERYEAVPLVVRTRNSTEQHDERPSLSRFSRPSDAQKIKEDNLQHNLHMLLLMTWLLPLTAPVLAVWVRTLLTAGYTTPFDGDHNFLAVLPFLIYVDFASWTPGILFERTKIEKRVPLRWFFVLAAGTAIVYGSRKPFLVLDVARVAMWIVVVTRIGRRYWGGSPWTDGNDSG